MTCWRCKGLMVACGPLRFQAALSTDTSDPAHHISARRCPCCGNYEDKQVLRNRVSAGVR
jgi:hypothetical protein